jgi:hypothetical protein
MATPWFEGRMTSRIVKTKFKMNENIDSSEIENSLVKLKLNKFLLERPPAGDLIKKNIIKSMCALSIYWMLGVYDPFVFACPLSLFYPDLT